MKKIETGMGIAAEAGSVLSLVPPPSPSRWKAVALVCAALSLAALLPGCDEVYEFLGMGGEATPEKKPEQPEQPEQPPSPPTEETPMADGGEVSFIPGESEGAYYEVHTFRTEENTPLGGQAEHTLTFVVNRPASVEVLVVAGGGGGGGGKLGTGGGGGAGRFIYHPSFQLADAGSISVKVGAGGSSGSTADFYQGGDGGDSEFVRDNSYQIIAKGGGGGACPNESGSGNNFANGRNGGSGGGGGADSDSQSFTGGTAMEGTVPPATGVLNLGTDGNKVYIGGGAGGQGLGSESAISGTPTIYATGGTNKVRQVQNGTGDGGYSAAKQNGGSGGSGIVIVRFPYTAP